MLLNFVHKISLFFILNCFLVLLDTETSNHIEYNLHLLHHFNKSHFYSYYNNNEKRQCLRVTIQKSEIDKMHQISQKVNSSSASLNPGEMGKPYIIQNTTSEQDALISEGLRRHFFNEYVSDQISLHRSLPDYRNKWCRNTLSYHVNLLPASIIICFHNEALSVLLRTIHSILHRSPAKYLKEIVLIDDDSNFQNLKNDLNDHLRKLNKVKFVRSNKRLGLIKARMLGAARANGPILIFLDSHVEVTQGWLEPLLHRISENWTNVVCPVIDVIDANTLEYKVSEKFVTTVGGFNWNLIFTWKTVTYDVLRLLKTPIDPVPTPTMAGGLFAIHKKFFYHLGQYDEEYEVWGAENLELSFKIWMCGGRLEILPCSHVGHIYRKRSPYSRIATKAKRYRNYVRLAAVWLDDYARYFYDRIGNQLGDYGNISSRVKLRDSLNCQTFDWYLKNVYPDMFNPKTAVAAGEIRNAGFDGKYCLDGDSTYDKKERSYNKPIGWLCHKNGGNQHWYYTKWGEIRRDEICLDFSLENGLLLYPCHSQKGNQLWQYDSKNGFIIHQFTQLCLTLDKSEKVTIAMRPCQSQIKQQQWTFRKTKTKAIQKIAQRSFEFVEKYKENY